MQVKKVILMEFPQSGTFMVVYKQVNIHAVSKKKVLRPVRLVMGSGGGRGLFKVGIGWDDLFLFLLFFFFFFYH